MSLFRLREWWQTRQGSGDEEFGQGSIAIGNADNAAYNKPKIVTGSFSGVLRIYQPRGKNFNPADQLMEQQLDLPILQLALGKFSSGASIALAILHPRSLAVYQVTRPAQEIDDDVPFLELQQLQHHNLSHAAANMCCGPFGGAQSHEPIIVQAIDGQIYIFEQGQLVQTTYFEDFLIPGPLACIPSTDSIVTCSSAFELQSYTYASLVHANASKSDLAAGMANLLTHRNTPVPNWAMTVGEHATDIQVLPIDGATQPVHDIVVIGERTIFICSQGGKLKSQRRLDYHPAAAIAYRLPNGSYNLLVGTHTCNYVIYGGDCVLWLAKGPTVPVAVRVAHVSALEAAIVILDDEGLLSVCYPGTAPPAAVLGLADQREHDWEHIQARRKELAKLIRAKAEPSCPINAAAGGTAEQHSQTVMTIRSQVPKVLAVTECDSRTSAELNWHSKRPCEVKIFLGNAGSRGLGSVSIAVQAQPPIEAAWDASSITTLRAGLSTPQVIPITFSHLGSSTPASTAPDTQVEVTAYAVDDDGQHCCACHVLALPLALFVQAVPPSRKSAVKLTIDMSGELPALNELFQDVAASSPPEATSHATADAIMTFRFWNRQECSILASGGGSRLRLQGTSFPAIGLIFAELVDRLSLLQPSSGAGSSRVAIEEPVPLGILFDSIDKHFALRTACKELRQQLEQAADQFRVAQKALLLRYKEAHPQPIGSLHLFLEETLEELAALSDHVHTSQGSLTESASELEATLRCMLLCLRCRCPGMQDKDFGQLMSHLCPHVNDTDELGWEEIADAGVLELLRGPLARNAQEQAAVAGLDEPFVSCEKLKRHLEILVDRVEDAKGQVFGR